MDPVTAIVLSIIGAVVTGGAGAATTHYLGKRKNRSRVSLELSYQLSILILAVQQTGKTTFIRKLFNDTEADPTQRTKTVRKYSKLVSLPENKDKGCEIFVTDYDGGDLKQLSDALGDGLAPVETTVVGVFVDATDGNDVEEVNEVRVQTHINSWDLASMQLILGQAPHAKYFFVYVNKSDLIPDAARGDYPERYSAIADAIAEASGDPSVQADVFVGSLERGEHLPTIIDNAMKVRVRANHDR